MQYAPKKQKRGSSVTSKNENSKDYSPKSNKKIKSISEIRHFDIDHMNISEAVSSFESSPSRFNDISDSSSEC